MKRLALAILSAVVFLGCVAPAPEPAPPPTYQPAPADPPPTIPQPIPPEATPTTTPSGAVCGAQQPACAEGSFCRFSDADRCGEGGATGLCEPIPTICNRMYAPVCGCDGKTHSNSCSALAKATNIRSKGACEDTATQASCGGITGKICPSGTTCTDDPKDSCDPNKGGRDCMGICVQKKVDCTPVRCKMYCKNGWQVGPDGCEICACAK